jgi:hypothetical protein
LRWGRGVREKEVARVREKEVERELSRGRW